jgi:hypothetical protein
VFYESLAIRRPGAGLVYGPGRDMASKFTTYSTACALFPVPSAVPLRRDLLDVFGGDYRNCGMAHRGFVSVRSGPAVACACEDLSAGRSLRGWRLLDLI